MATKKGRTKPPPLAICHIVEYRGKCKQNYGYNMQVVKVFEETVSMFSTFDLLTRVQQPSFSPEQMWFSQLKRRPRRVTGFRNDRP